MAIIPQQPQSKSKCWLIMNSLQVFFKMVVTKGPGKRGHIVEDTLLPMMFLGLRQLGNICCGHKMFLNKIRNTFLCQ